MKRKPTQEELIHDPSLRFAPEYHKWEALMSDLHGRTVRFVRYLEGGLAEVTEVDHAPILESVPLVRLSRVTANWTREQLNAK